MGMGCCSLLLLRWDCRGSARGLLPRLLRRAVVVTGHSFVG